MKEFNLGRIAGLDLSVEPLAFFSSIGLFIVLCIVAVAALAMSWPEAIVLALLCVVLHWLSETVHQFGHSRAARQTGYPMRGIRYGTLGLLSTALYPAGEPVLPGPTHIHRALGGPKASGLFSVFTALLVVLLWNAGPILQWGALFFFVDNFLVLALGSLLPLGFTDGSTILRWRGKA